MKKPARRLKHPKKTLAKASHQTYHKSMQGNRRLLFPLLLVAVLFLAAAFYFSNSRKSLSPVTQPPATPKQLLLTCPLPSAFCKDANSFKEGSFSAQLKEKTPIIAVTGGLIKGASVAFEKTKGQEEEYKLISITDPDSGISAMYYFKGELNINAMKGKIKEGEIIATASGQLVNFLDGKSFVMYLTKQTAEGTKLQPVSAANFK
ncbi:hypothetical protein A3J19_02515 [Candidatus Daviesbacteria bacterium RIFCSPLOWO2_02_FULL_41_8]|uniref:Uncharacterized protein n=3 Tax=Candidatus Daviesiibacteriota TaxID=1752718 RepID=A0A1F5NG93_9BACT|nr:MAG: hypothetical protein A2871_02185 [Candidatus Daviesbacteria bacterium RIFCSPHIGHO2_01_FULL_41_23]OGE32754.1 MAG: hypothetical protein A3D83_03605 [Candidatus Daviesbacteria bacterium RIFCSPHIGHO2_02_FULL_41_10]OGE76721.1 MAG: hypothetical protein A3J19_02515 [Candidatus Daviesbacteria bacterium RIFCSPLOWO2_02_FULL_41_8]